MDFLIEYVLEPPGIYLLLTVVFAYPLTINYVLWADWYRRRRAWRAFAAAKGWSFSGTTASDGRDPFIRFPSLKWSITLSHVVEGTCDGFSVAVFERGRSRGVGETNVLVVLPVQPPEYSPALNRDLSLQAEAGACAILVAIPRKSLMPNQGVALLERAVAIARDVVAEVDGTRLRG